MGDITVIAIDWSGARDASGQQKNIWVTGIRGGEVFVRRNGWTRRTVIAFVADLPGPLVVGFDFSFSFPQWFPLAHGCTTIAETWDLAAHEGERWLQTVTPPFWRSECIIPEHLRFRACERALFGSGVAPKSVFQLVGNGQVGPGSVRGMPLLRDLRAAGFAVWPFDAPAHRTACEIYPSLLEQYAADRYAPYIDGNDRAATVAAEVMWDHRASFAVLPRATGTTGVEGQIWAPALW